MDIINFLTDPYPVPSPIRKLANSFIDVFGEPSSGSFLANKFINFSWYVNEKGIEISIFDKCHYIIKKIEFDEEGNYVENNTEDNLTDLKEWLNGNTFGLSN